MITDILLCILLCIFAVSLYFSVLIITAVLMLDNFNPDVDHATFIICGIRKIKIAAIYHNCRKQSRSLDCFNSA